MKIGAILLAAGKSTRFTKGNKLLVNYRGKPLIQWSIELINTFDFHKKCVVVNKEIEIPPNLLKNFLILFNPHPEKGISSSIKIAVSNLKDEVDGFLFFLADMPDIKKRSVEKVLQEVKKADIVFPVYNGKKGFPTFVSGRLYNEIMNLEGDVGIRKLINTAKDSVFKIPVDDEGVIRDIDTISDIF